ncbi:MAG: pyridoxal phosphate-dependent aminotransferase [Desulfobacterales bacterium]
MNGDTVIDFAVGEPHYDTPAPVIEATGHALESGNTRYSPVAGLPALRSRLSEFFPGCDERNVIISNGSKHALFLIFQVILNPDDEVIIPRPYWVSFVEQVKMAGGRPVFVDTVSHQLDIAAIRRMITDKTKAVVINSPNNPTGAVYRDGDVQSVLRLAPEKKFFVVSDEAYASFIYDGVEAKSPYTMAVDHDYLIVTRSFSKHFHMTGFRIGYTVAARRIINAMAAYQSHCTGNVCTFAQYGALAALDMDEAFFASRLSELAQKRDSMINGIREHFDVIRPGGAFYVFPSIAEYVSSGDHSSDFAADLFEKTGVAVVPGEVFGSPGHIRMSYAVEEHILLEGIERMNRYMSQVKK